MSPAIGRGRRFARDDRAATAIEFGILALPFFTLIFATLETAMVFFAGQVLDSAVNDSSRLIRTGQAQAGGYDANAYRAAICTRLYGMFDCNDHNKLRIKVSVVSSFSTANPAPPITCNPSNTACSWTVVQSYTPGTNSSVVMVEAYYKWPTMISLPGFDLATMPDGTRLLAAVRLFQNEP
ncbi:MAG: pilus assembly protein [Devosia sp.]|nr:pilus assembly protein [Devosia sp.]